MQIPSLLNQQRIHIPQYKHKYAKKKNSHNSTAQKYKNLEKLYMSMIIIKDYYFAGFQSIRCNKT